MNRKSDQTEPTFDPQQCRIVTQEVENMIKKIAVLRIYLISIAYMED